MKNQSFSFDLRRYTPMRRWNYKLFLIIFLGSFLFLGSMNRNANASSIFGKDKKTPRAIVVFVDMSGSTNKARRTVYRKAFDKIYQNLRQGDRIVVGTITSHSYIDFKPVIDAEIPKQSLWDNRLQC
jgi:ssDNA-specific exonuclease RecJ